MLTRMLPLLAAASAMWAQTLTVDAPPAPLQLDYYPQDGARVRTNPPAFVWVPVRNASRYVVQMSRSAAFPDAGTVSLDSQISLSVPRRTFEPGVWFWRYGALAADNARPVFSRARRFEIAGDAVELPFPDVSRLVKQLAGMHPRIGIRAAELEKVRARAKTDMREAVQPVVAAAEKAIGGPNFPEPAFLPPRGDPRRAAEYTRTFQALRPYLAGMVACADAYLLTGEERYGHEARRRLMHVMTWDPEGSTSLHNNDEPGMQLPRDVGRTYDYIYPLLGPDERRKVGAVMAVRLGQIYNNLRGRPFESSPFESHALGSYINNLTEGLLAMAGDLDVEAMLEYALMQFWSPYYPPFGGEDGGWSEGPSYWSWSAGRFVRTFALIEQNTGIRISRRPWLRNTPYFKMYVNPPYSRMAPFGDSQDNTVGFDTMYFMGAMLQNPYALWYAAGRNFRPQGADAFLFERRGLEPKAPEDLPQARAFFDAGLVAMHSTLADGARNVQFLMRSSPFGSTSHSYADQNAFVVHAYGEPLAVSSGYYDYYGSPHHMQWTWQTKAHNTILVNGEGQQTRSIGAKGRIAQFATNDYAHYALGDARLAYAGRLDRFDRHVVYLRPRGEEPPAIVIYDDLESPKPATWQWLLHALEKMEIEPGAGTVNLKRGQARLQARFLAPEGLSLEQTGAFPVDPSAEFIPKWKPRWHLTAAASKPSARQEFLTVLLPYPDGRQAALAGTRRLVGKGCEAVELRTASTRHVVLFRRAGHSGAMEAAGLSSNARILAEGFAADGRSIGRLEVR